MNKQMIINLLKICCEMWVLSHICQKIKLDQTFTSLDTTTFSLNVEYQVDSDEQEITITHDYSKAHQLDLKQFILELVTSQGVGIPLMMKCLDSNASDNKVFQQRSQQFLTTFKTSQEPRYLVGDSKLYHKNNKENLTVIKYITPDIEHILM
jgi:transposase